MGFDSLYRFIDKFVLKLTGNICIRSIDFPINAYYVDFYKNSKLQENELFSSFSNKVTFQHRRAAVSPSSWVVIGVGRCSETQVLLLCARLSGAGMHSLLLQLSFSPR
jgi:hypothetical protein